MSDGFNLDLRGAEEEIAESDYDGEVILGVLDGTTPAAEWIDAIDEGKVLVLAVEGDLNELAADFAGPIRESGGQLMHFRQFLVVTPPGVDIDSSRL